VNEFGLQSNSLNLLPEQRERESAIKKFYDTKFNQLASQIQIADAKAIEFHSQLQKIKTELDEKIEERNKAQEALNEIKKQLDSTKDEFDTTKRNYIEQHRLMTEHICSINQNISTLEDELSQVKEKKGAMRQM